jgi:glutaredoxin 3
MAKIEMPDEVAAAGRFAPVRLYTLAGCGACSFARGLLRRRGIPFDEIRGEGMPGFRRMLLETTGSPTVPQIVIDGEPVGGADALHRLDHLGVLVPRVKRESFPITVVRRRQSLLRLLTGRPRGYEVALVDRDGRAIERAAAGSREEAEGVARELAEGGR